MWNSKQNTPLLCFLAISILKSIRAELAVTWISPSSGDLFGTGDIITAKWSATKVVDSPSFRLCFSKEALARDNRNDFNDSCGLAVWPLVTKSAGSYFASLAVPNVTGEEEFYLAMEDDLEKTLSSTFSITSSIINTENDPPYVPLNPSQSPSSSDSRSPTTNPPFPSPTLAPTAIYTGPTAVLTPSIVPYLTATYTPPPAAAFAVPLSLVGAIVLVATALSCRQYRSLKNERASDAEKIDMFRRSSFSSLRSASTRRSDAKRSLDVPSNNDVGHRLTPTSVFHVRREPRQSTRHPFPAACSTTASMHEAVPASIFGPLPHATSKPASNVSADTSVTSLVLSNYILPSPTLSSPLLLAPQRLHVRSEAAMSSSFTTESYLYRDKIFPSRPRQSPVGRNVYDAVAQAVSHQ